MRICVSVSMHTDERGNWFSLIRLVELGSGEVLRTIAKTYRRTLFKDAMHKALNEGLFEAKDFVENGHVMIESLIYGYPELDIVGVKYLA
ncbi:hypothetical protein DNHGIG_00580 [Collibacillus ludicampi]|uniref:Uncharacterized protein n=1 Tax=Collibacillus ludicampi TaxID=2771369 RepID=A0AAV4LA21_9BACL|nr:hypothetical protein [Collibacillus ludicampi]GIM44509.1 hypothetical protein DNHGIG_00580 [Collibacillus ludicampi]